MKGRIACILLDITIRLNAHMIGRCIGRRDASERVFAKYLQSIRCATDYLA